MRLSTKARYAVTALMEIVVRDGRKPVTLADISRVQNISVSYLEQLFARMRRRGLVESLRGPGGGYRLLKSPEDISMAEIVAAVDDKLDIDCCEGREVSQVAENPMVNEMWSDLSRQIYQFLGDVTLAQLIERHSRGEGFDKTAEGDSSEVSVA